MAARAPKRSAAAAATDANTKAAEAKAKSKEADFSSASAAAPSPVPDRTLARLPNVLVQAVCSFLEPPHVLRLGTCNRALRACLDGSASGAGSAYWWSSLGLMPDAARNPMRLALTALRIANACWPWPDSDHMSPTKPLCPPVPTHGGAPTPLLLTAMGGALRDADTLTAHVQAADAADRKGDEKLSPWQQRERANAHRAAALWTLLDRLPDKALAGVRVSDTNADGGGRAGYLLPHDSLFYRADAVYGAHSELASLRTASRPMRDIVRWVVTASPDDDAWAYEGWAGAPRKVRLPPTAPGAAPKVVTVSGAVAAVPWHERLRAMATVDTVGAAVAIVVSLVLLYLMSQFQP